MWRNSRNKALPANVGLTWDFVWIIRNAGLSPVGEEQTTTPVNRRKIWTPQLPGVRWLLWPPRSPCHILTKWKAVWDGPWHTSRYFHHTVFLFFGFSFLYWNSWRSLSHPSWSKLNIPGGFFQFFCHYAKRVFPNLPFCRFPQSGFVFYDKIALFFHNTPRIICLLVIKNRTKSSSDKYSTWCVSKRYLVINNVLCVAESLWLYLVDETSVLLFPPWTDT